MASQKWRNLADKETINQPQAITITKIYMENPPTREKPIGNSEKLHYVKVTMIQTFHKFCSNLSVYIYIINKLESKPFTSLCFRKTFRNIQKYDGNSKREWYNICDESGTHKVVSKTRLKTSYPLFSQKLLSLSHIFSVVGS